MNRLKKIGKNLSERHASYSHTHLESLLLAKSCKDTAVLIERNLVKFSLSRRIFEKIYNFFLLQVKLYKPVSNTHSLYIHTHTCI